MKLIINTIQEISQSHFGVTFIPEIVQCPKEELWEYCFNVFGLAKIVNKTPNDISKDFEELLSKEKVIFTRVNSTWGYVNFTLDNQIWMRLFDNFELPKYPNKAKNIVVDYIWMNVWKPPHIWHICTPLQGQAIINLLSYYGYNVISDSHFWDWWSLFWKLIVWFRKYWNEISLKDDAIEHLLEVYIKINSEIEKDVSIEQECRDAFKKLSSGDKEYIAYWDSFTQASIDTANKMLTLMNIKQTYDIGESFYEGLDLPVHGDNPRLQFNMNDIVNELLQKNIATKNEDGSIGIIFPDSMKLPSTILQKKDGTNLYLTSDLAAIKYRITNWWNPVKILYFIDIRQQLHFKQVFSIAKMAWPDILNDTELYHAANGALTLPEGAMSTRKGNIIRLDALAEEGFIRTQKIIDEKWRVLSESDIKNIAIWAIKYSYLSQDRERDIVFNWDKALTFEWNSGPYIQYAFVRANRILKEIGDLQYKVSEKELNLSLQDKKLIRMLLTFPEVIEKAVQSYKAHYIAIFSYELATLMNEFYVHSPKILEEKNVDLKNFRIELIRKSVSILEKSFWIIWINMPSAM